MITFRLLVLELNDYIIAPKRDDVVLDNASADFGRFIRKRPFLLPSHPHKIAVKIVKTIGVVGDRTFFSSKY